MLKAANAVWAGLLKELTGYNDAKDCYKGSALGCGFTALFFTPFKLLKVLKVGENITDAVRVACSFSGDMQVLMADGSTKPIDEVRVGDEVMATDPETGEQGSRKVTHVWIHDDKLTDLVLDNGAVVTTTEDHPFWNATDHQWQRADSLGAGEILLGPNGRQTQVVGLRYGPALSAPAYNLTVADIHTYYVLAGNTPVLVHNSGPFCGTPFGKNTPGDELFHGTDYSLDEMTQFVYGHTGAGNPAMRRPSMAQIEATLRSAGPVRIGEQNAASFDYNGVRVIINYDMPWKSTA